MEGMQSPPSLWEWAFDRSAPGLPCGSYRPGDSCGYARAVCAGACGRRPSAHRRGRLTIPFGRRVKEASRRGFGKLRVPAVRPYQPHREHDGKVGVSVCNQLRHLRGEVSGLEDPSNRPYTVPSHRCRRRSDVHRGDGDSLAASRHRNVLASSGVSDGGVRQHQRRPDGFTRRPGRHFQPNDNQRTDSRRAGKRSFAPVRSAAVNAGTRITKSVNRIRTRLILAFLLATALPLIATVWIMSSLLERSLDFATTEQLDRLSKSLQETGRHYYQQARESLRWEAQSGTLPYKKFLKTNESSWPSDITDFWHSGEPERFVIAGSGGDRLDYLVRREDAIWSYSRDLGPLHMDDLAREYREARQLVQSAKERDLRRGFTTTLIVLVAAVWIASFVWLVYLANRVSRPMQQLTAGLGELAAGRLDTRIPAEGADEIGRAIAAFNRSAAELQHNRERLVYLTQIASWQTLARKMAHE